MRDWERSSSQWPHEDLQLSLNDRTEWDCLIGLMILSFMIYYSYYVLGEQHAFIGLSLKLKCSVLLLFLFSVAC